MRLTFKLAVLLITLLLLELSVRVAVGQGWLRYSEKRPEGGGSRYIEDLNPHFGVWHLPNVQLEGIRTNSQGMRDPERSQASGAAERIVVLGDSFVEGYGVVDGQRMTDWLERTSGVEHLNFGVSGNFGPVQEWLCYEHLAARFDHTAVYLFCLPDNDFEDLLPLDPRRYRPYLRPSDEPGQYEVYYPVEFSEPTPPRAPSLSKQLRQKLRNASYLLNAIGQMRFENAFPSLVRGEAGYDRFSPETGQQLLYAYSRLAALAAPRPLWVFVIPRHADLLAHRAGELQGSAPQLLADWAEAQSNVHVVDLLPLFEAELQRLRLKPKDLFLPNDGHWSPLGNRLAAEVVQRATHPAAAPPSGAGQ
jgi:SGNH hydrolase-like domain, acetyltransferase AlgX